MNNNYGLILNNGNKKISFLNSDKISENETISTENIDLVSISKLSTLNGDSIILSNNNSYSASQYYLFVYNSDDNYSRYYTKEYPNIIKLVETSSRNPGYLGDPLLKKSRHEDIITLKFRFDSIVVSEKTTIKYSAKNLVQFDGINYFFGSENSDFLKLFNNTSNRIDSTNVEYLNGKILLDNEEIGIYTLSDNNTILKECISNEDSCITYKILSGYLYEYDDSKNKTVQIIYEVE